MIATPLRRPTVPGLIGLRQTKSWISAELLGEPLEDDQTGGSGSAHVSSASQRSASSQRRASD
jgi:hypothetical protein